MLALATGLFGDPDANSDQNLSGFEEWIQPEHVAAPKPIAAPAVRPPGISSVGNAGNFSPAGSAIWHDLSTPPNPRTVLEQFDDFRTPDSQVGGQQFLGPKVPQFPQSYPKPTSVPLLDLGGGPGALAAGQPGLGVNRDYRDSQPNLGDGAWVSGVPGALAAGTTAAPAQFLSGDALVAHQIALKSKEADSIHVGTQFPTAPQFKSWKRQLVQRVAAAAGPHGDRACQWMDMVDHLTIEELANPYPFHSLDNKLSAELFPLFKGPMGRKLDLKYEEVRKSGGILRGRQRARMIYDENTPEGESLGVQAQQNANALQCQHIEHFETYLATLDSIVNVSVEDFSDTVLENLLFKQMENSLLSTWILPSTNDPAETSPEIILS